jgi:hypothetical protein
VQGVDSRIPQALNNLKPLMKIGQIAELAETKRRCYLYPLYCLSGTVPLSQSSLSGTS